MKIFPKGTHKPPPPSPPALPLSLSLSISISPLGPMDLYGWMLELSMLMMRPSVYVSSVGFSTWFRLAMARSATWRVKLNFWCSLAKDSSKCSALMVAVRTQNTRAPTTTARGDEDVEDET